RGLLEGLRRADPERVIRRITVCEIDRRKYAALARALLRLARTDSDEQMEVIVDEAAAAATSETGRGRGVPRPTATRASDPVYLLATLEPVSRAGYLSRTSLLTAGAKAAVLAGTVEVKVGELQRQIGPLEQGEVTSRDMARIGTALARSLLPPAVREGLAAMASRPLVVVHDREASRVPWEVLQIGATHPALGAGLSRRYASEALTVARWREEADRSGPLRLLLVVNPTGDLPGAAAEGEALQQLFRQRAAVTCEVLEGPAATRARIVAALGAGSHDVLHFAGHAFFDPAAPASSGLLCAGREVLRSGDLAAITALPALVFCNACEAARVRRRARPGLRGTLTSVAEAFLARGVANFMGTHWPVGDEAAFAFSRALYESLLQGDSLGAAILAARRRIAAIPSVDWADYVHYGSHEFRLVDAPDR
ncbi:MAG: CHAT domain-containing protein, partial [Steroidobacteraceae bacterium]